MKNIFKSISRNIRAMDRLTKVVFAVFLVLGVRWLVRDRSAGERDPGPRHDPLLGIHHHALERAGVTGRGDAAREEQGQAEVQPHPVRRAGRS